MANLKIPDKILEINDKYKLKLDDKAAPKHSAENNNLTFRTITLSFLTGRQI